MTIGGLFLEWKKLKNNKYGIFFKSIMIKNPPSQKKLKLKKHLKKIDNENDYAILFKVC